MTLIDTADAIDSPQTTGSPIPGPIMKLPCVLGYEFGNNWRTFGPYCQARPDLAKKGWVVSVTLTCLGHSRMYDIEPGGGENKNIGIFMANADRSDGLPWLYTFASNGEAMLNAAKGFGYTQGKDFYYYSSHDTQQKHICGSSGCNYPKADGTQYSFAGSYDLGVVNDYMLPGATPQPAPVPQASYLMFPTNLPANLPNHGSERLTVEQADGALEHPVKFHDYLKGTLWGELKIYRDRIWQVAHNPLQNGKPTWGEFYRGARWQAINHRMTTIQAL
jgi:hypothetical protein